MSKTACGVCLSISLSAVHWETPNPKPLPPKQKFKTKLLSTPMLLISRLEVMPDFTSLFFPQDLEWAAPFAGGLQLRSEPGHAIPRVCRRTWDTRLAF